MPHCVCAFALASIVDPLCVDHLSFGGKVVNAIATADTSASTLAAVQGLLLLTLCPNHRDCSHRVFWTTWKLRARSTHLRGFEVPLACFVACGGPLFCSPPVPVRCRDYDVVPIGPRAGLIRWLQAACMLHCSSVRSWKCTPERLCQQVGEDKKHLIVESSTDVWHRKWPQTYNIGAKPGCLPSGHIWKIQAQLFYMFTL
eukprot:5098600-Amphidinium_carterae.2